MAKQWVTCPQCGSAFDAQGAACPQCGSEKGTGVFSLKGPPGAPQKRLPSPFPRRSACLGVLLGLLAAALAAWAVVRLSRPPEPRRPPRLQPPLARGRDPFEGEPEAPPRPPLPALDQPRATPAPPATERFHGALRVLPDGRVELSYDFASAAELRDWRPAAGDEPSVAFGEARLGGPRGNCIMYIAPFAGDIEIAGTWRQLQALQADGDCSINFCNLGADRYYGVSLASFETKIFKNNGRNRLATQPWDCVAGRSHRFRIERLGEAIRVWVDDQLVAGATDGDYTSGSVGVGAWYSLTAIEDIRITGRLDPSWLARNPGAVAQIEAARKGQTERKKPGM